ncbi:hypothetical protein NMG60_11036592 [Bertholletia excelsa]
MQSAGCSLATAYATPATSASLIATKNRNPKCFSFSTFCKAKANNSLAELSEEVNDIYELLGVESNSPQSEIKSAYRALQKRCHPDIAGPAGHDMAIILNQAYSLLSDPISRSAYDKERAKVAELRGYTGKPIYSVWLGAETEQRAVFVDEVKCVGCLKCALLAQNTFAVESVYGRARVVAQWADTHSTIQEAIDACPVDCISIVERSNLAALEFLMSKQPRGNVRVGAGNTVGTRVSNIFVDVDKFQARFREVTNKASTKRSKESDSQRQARRSTIEAIKSISNWIKYWQIPRPSTPSSPVEQSRGENLKYLIAARAGGDRSEEPSNTSNISINKLQEAAAARKHARENPQLTTTSRRSVSSNYNVSTNGDEYWTPSQILVLPEDSSMEDISGSRRKPSTSGSDNKRDFVANMEKENSNETQRYSDHPFTWGIPTVLATIAAAVIRLQLISEPDVSGGGKLEEHIGGSLALQIINSSWLQVLLAALTWYLIGMAIVQLVAVLGSKATAGDDDVYKKK